MKHNPVYKPIDALPLMGITCTCTTADEHIRNMNDAGLLKASFKLNKRWKIAESDIEEIRELIVSGKYIPSAKHFKKAA